MALNTFIRDGIEPIKYEHNGKDHYYHPDFLLLDSNQLVEIKGDHFFEDNDPSKKLRPPFRRKSMTDEQYNALCDLYEAKQKCMAKHNVKVITSSEYSKYLKYLHSKFSGKEIRQMRRKKRPQE